MLELLEDYLQKLHETSIRGDAREESYYSHLAELIKGLADLNNISNIEITILPKKTEAGNPDFRIWDGSTHITGYIEAKEPFQENLDFFETTEQIQRYLSTFPNFILTNFYEFRLFRNGQLIERASIGRPLIAKKLDMLPPIENIDKFRKLMNLFFSFSLPKIENASALAVELAKRTRFLRDEVITVELQSNDSKEYRQIIGFYEAFKNYLIGNLTKENFADLYSQTLTFGLFAARTRSNGIFNRRYAFDYIPRTIGILRDIFRFISLEEPPKSLQVIVEDISEILNVTDVRKILSEYENQSKGSDPILHFYETFLATYDPVVRERRGVYYTPEPIVNYIVKSVQNVLKSNFNLPDGLSSTSVKLLDPAGGTLTFPAEAIKVAASEFKSKYGTGGINNWIKEHILKNFYAFELMMAPYVIGHIKIGFILDELGYRLSDDERFQLYLTNTLEMDEIELVSIPGLSSLTEESHFAGEIKKTEKILVIIGNPPYSGISANVNQWTEKLLKEDINGLQSYYKVDDNPLDEKNPKWLQDDYVKFIRFAQWKIHSTGFGVVGMITNHSYLDNPTFRGMRQSLMKTFDEIYIINLHGNSLKKETTPDGGKDENVFDIRQGTAIAIFIRNKEPKTPQVFYKDLYGLREEKYNWLRTHIVNKKHFQKIRPQSPFYFFVHKDTSKIKHYARWKSINEIFPINSVGIVTARDNFAIGFEPQELKNRLKQFVNPRIPDELIAPAYNLKNKSNWNLTEARKSLQECEDFDSLIQNILYRPFDKRFIIYHPALVERMRFDVMQHMFKKNLGLITVRQVAEGQFNHSFITNVIIESRVTLSNKGIAYIHPLYRYTKGQTKKPRSRFSVMMVFEPEEEYYSKTPNISPVIFDKLEKKHHKKPLSEEILYYIYAILYSNIYREKYREFLTVDFPRIPFTADKALFNKISLFGEKLAKLHLLTSPILSQPIVKYQGLGANDKIERITYIEKENRIIINKDKYFEGVSPEVWNYYIGGYRVAEKYLKERKGMNIIDAPLYCKIVTAISETINLQMEIDKIYNDIENDVIIFD